MANKLDIERPESCFGRPAAETPADLVQVTGELLINNTTEKGSENEYATLVTSHTIAPLASSRLQPEDDAVATCRWCSWMAAP